MKKYWLSVSGGHELYVEESGNPKGKPIIFLHGGPGVGVKSAQLRFFDPKKWRIINFAQRGSSPSRWVNLIEKNTTWDLIEDMEKIRKLLKVKNWTLFGGSWGATLALAYSISYPKTVSGIILRGTYLARPQDSTWFFHNEQDPKTAWPEWTALRKLINPASDESMDEQLSKLTLSADRKTRTRSRKAWLEYADSVARAEIQKPDFYSDEAAEADSNPVLESLYAFKKAFFPTTNYIIENIAKIREIPAIIIHGMSDRTCPVSGALELSHAWPEAQIILLPGTGHSADEPEIEKALIQATDQFAAKK